MKKIMTLVIVLIFLGINAQAASISSAVAKYKRQNYVGCITDLNDVMTQLSKTHKDTETMGKVMSVVSKYDLSKLESGDYSEISKLTDDMKTVVTYKKDDAEKWAYIFYYYALSLHQIGAGNARSYYEIATKFSPNTRIGEYSKIAMKCLDSPDACKNSDIDEFIRSGKQVSDEIIKEELKNDLRRHKDNINAGRGLSSIFKKDDKIAWADEGVKNEISEIGKQEYSNNTPTDEEIGRAVRTLQKAGINPMSYMSAPINNEYAQLNALLNDGNSYSNDYATMMMMNNGTGKISPELMQTIMRQQMMSGYGSF